jgi:hypothetical protein
VQAHAELRGNDVLIIYDQNDTIVLHNVALASLTAADFTFG